MEALIEIENLSRNYEGIAVVDDISFQLHSGEVLGFLGPNGAGKSTTMQMICGALAPTTGRITLNGTDLLSKPKVAKAQLGYLPDPPPLYPEMSVDEYLSYCAKLRSIDNDNTEFAVRRVKQQCGLQDKSRQLVGTLSKGYQQRVGIAQAIIHDPKVIVLDEPTNGLDPNQARQIRQLIKALSEERGILLSTHILSEVQAVCDRVIIIHRGKLLFSQQVDDYNGTEAIQIQLRNPPNVFQLQQLASVASVAAVAGHSNRFDIRLSSQSDSGQLARDVANKDWGLELLQPSRPNLEQLFYQLTQGEMGS